MINIAAALELVISICFTALQCAACCTLQPCNVVSAFPLNHAIQCLALAQTSHLFLQMLDRYVQDSIDNAHASSQDGSEASDIEHDAEAETSTASGSSRDVDGKQQPPCAQQQQEESSNELLHLQMLRLDSEHALHSSTGPVSAEQSDRPHTPEWQNSHDSNDRPTDGSDDLHEHDDTDSPVGCGAPQHLPVDLPDHAAVRRREEGARVLPCNEAQDLDESSTISHTSQIPSQQAVKQRVVDQQRSRMRRQVLSRASRNAQKVGNKKERKQTANSMTW